MTIDPAGSRDLDQAFHAERRPHGFRVRYAIADVAAFVAPGGALDREAFARGVTLYLPDGRAPLYPDVLGEGAASLAARRSTDPRCSGPSSSIGRRADRTRCRTRDRAQPRRAVVRRGAGDDRTTRRRRHLGSRCSGRSGSACSNASGSAAA